MALQLNAIKLLKKFAKLYPQRFLENFIFNNNCRYQNNGRSRNSSPAYFMRSTCQQHTTVRPRISRDLVYARENGLLTRDHEFSSCYSGVSTCGDSDGLRARAARRLSSPRRALRREGRGKDRFAGTARSLAPFHFCDDC